MLTSALMKGAAAVTDGVDAPVRLAGRLVHPCDREGTTTDVFTPRRATATREEMSPVTRVILSTLPRSLITSRSRSPGVTSAFARHVNYLANHEGQSDAHLTCRGAQVAPT